MLRPSKRSVRLLSCLVSDGIRKRPLSIHACTDRSHRSIMDYTMYGRFSLLSDEKRCRYTSLSTSTSISNESVVSVKNYVETPNAARRLQHTPIEAEKLMEKVVGSFQFPEDYDIARGWIIKVVKDDSSSPNVINLSVQLFERVVREYSQLLASESKDIFFSNKSSKDAFLWFCSPFTVSSVYSRWRDASIRNEDVLSPRDMIQKLQSMSVLLPEHFRYDIATMNVIMHALICREPLHRAPYVAEKLVDFIAAEFSTRAENGDTSMRPTSYTYSMVLQAWSKSGLSNASAKMEEILRTVHKDFCSPGTPNDAISLVCYKICLRYWSKLKKTEEIDAIMSLLDENERLREKIDGALVSVVVNAYAQAGQAHKVESLYYRMIDQCIPSSRTASSIVAMKQIDNDLVEELMRGAFYLLTFYRQEVIRTLNRNRTSVKSKTITSQYTERAESVLNRIEELRGTDPDAIDRLHILMIDIYAEMNCLEKVQMILRRIEQPSRLLFFSLIKAYGKCQQPEYAEGLVRAMIKSPQYCNPNIAMINCLLNAWADAAFSHSHSAERALKVYQWLVDDPDVVALNLRPTVVTYSSLLKCFASSGSSADEIRQKVAMLVRDMENQYRLGNVSCQPNEIFFVMVIRAFLRANSPKEAETTLHVIEHQFCSASKENFVVRPSTRMYNEFLMYFSRLGTPSAAAKTTEFHDRMRKLSQTTDLSLKPNVYTYNVVLNGWASSNDANAGDQMWKIYEQMINVDRLELNKYNYTTLLAFYSKSKRLIDVRRALQLLHAMRESHNSDDLPQSKHYEMVLQTCMNSGALESAAETMISFMEAYAKGKCRTDGKPNPKFYEWIVTSLFRSNDPLDATRFVLDTLGVCKDKRVLSDFGLVSKFVLHLREEWTNSNHDDKDKYINQLDSKVIPALLYSHE